MVLICGCRGWLVVVTGCVHCIAHLGSIAYFAIEGVGCLHLIALWLGIVVANLRLAHPVLASSVYKPVGM